MSAPVRIFVVCTPKSGSSFVVTLLQKVTGFGHLNPVFGGGPMLEGDPYLPNLQAEANPSVSQLHCHAKAETLSICKSLSINPIFLTRNIFDSLLSMKEYLDEFPRRKMFPHYYELVTEEEKRDFLIDVYAPIFVRLAAGWHAAFSEQSASILWCTYEAFFGNPLTQTKRILQHVGLSYHERDIQEAIEATRKEAKATKFNKGVSGRGVAWFTAGEQRRIVGLIDSCTSFSAIGSGILAPKGSAFEEFGR